MNSAADDIRQSRRWLVLYPRFVPLAIFLAIAAITAVSIFAIERGEREREQAELRELARGVVGALERRGNASSAYLRAGAALFGTAGEVNATVFRRFISELRFDSDYRSAEGFGWAVAIRPEEVAEFEASVQEETPGRMRVEPVPSSSAELVVPVTFLQPDTERNRRALGFDMYSEPIRRAAMDEAVKNARPTASGRIILVQEGTGTDAGFLIYMPVFDSLSAERRLKGFIYSPFNTQDFLESALEMQSLTSRVVRLYNGPVAESNLVAQTIPETRVDANTAGNNNDVSSVTEDVLIANHAMTLKVTSSRNSFLSNLSMLTLLFGLLIASLLMVVARLLTQQALEDRASLDWLEEQNSIRNSLTRELNHRVKNTLANVLSIVSLTRRRATNLDDFATGIDGRIRALSATHDLLTQSEWGTTPIRSVVEAEIAPYARSADNEVVLDGPAVELAPNDALSLGLALHELATNAAKFGALSQPGAKVSVKWSLEHDRLARVEWIEEGGPAVPQDRKRGFGTDLIEKIVAHELKHPVTLDFDASGVRCVLLVPVRKPSDFAMRAVK
ncbi:Blue-light-activated histidine kinase [Alteripontixanthobacter maritimus]|uniref:histidine kinase n=1 Tax=Alteripontixanthobacter maritimus TaxID=2161824 RepID=A0A369QE15_9SPHN|nr:CHASE domain-containing protein [Alteripontixanthobacter maritimus]RDC60518.1 Blue-light-activated histidine kinase [Alteripontixanthobacter maritimus]